MAFVSRPMAFVSAGVAALLIAAAAHAARDGGGGRGAEAAPEAGQPAEGGRGGRGGGRGGGGRGGEAEGPPPPPPPPPRTPGEAVFRDSCSICHNAQAGAPTIIAPNLFGIVDRPAATEAGFFYSPAMKASNLTWNEVTLMAFLTSPQQIVPGTTMGMRGLIETADRENVIEYLKTLK